MSGLTGKNALSIRKGKAKETKTLSNGFTKIVFAHRASEGDTGIDLGALVVPPEMSALGFTNPSTARLLEARMFQFKDNLEVTSSLSNTLIQNLSYRVSSNSRITFDGFTASEGEIFVGVLDSNPISGIQVIDAKTQVSEGTLLANTTDFAIGFSTSTASNDIFVFRGGAEQKRNTNNSSTVMDGNYYVVEGGTGSGNVIRFNNADVLDQYVRVTTVGGTVESPTNSTWDELEKVQGQIDAMIPDLAQATGNPETDYQAAPNNVDLKQFGDRFIAVEEPGGGPKLSTASEDGAQKLNRIQRKDLTVTRVGNGTIPELSFNNLIVGRWYELTCYFDMRLDQGGGSAGMEVRAYNSTTTANFIGRHTFVISETLDADSDILITTSTLKFLAVNSSVNFQAVDSSGAAILNATSYVQLEERNDLVETTDFT